MNSGNLKRYLFFKNEGCRLDEFLRFSERVRGVVVPGGDGGRGFDKFDVSWLIGHIKRVQKDVCTRAVSLGSFFRGPVCL